MTMVDLAYATIAMGSCISIMGYVFGSVMENQKVRSLLLESWVALTDQFESHTVSKAHDLEIAKNIFGALYHRNGKLSHQRLATITVIVSACFFIGANIPKGSLNERLEFGWAPIFIMFGWIFIFYFYEYLAYRISRYFVDKTIQENKRIYLIANLIVVSLVMYGFPFLLSQVFFTPPNYLFREFPLLGPLSFSLDMFSPLTPMIYIFDQEHFPSYSNRLLMIPAALSFGFPVGLLLGSLALLDNKWTLGLLAKSVERISQLNARRIKLSSLGLLSFLSSVSGIIGFLTAK